MDVDRINFRDDGNAFIGVITDVTKNGAGDFSCERCCVFGISEDEFNTILGLKNAEIHPQEYTPDCPRFRVNKNAWTIIRAMGEKHGYTLGQQPVNSVSNSSTRANTVVITLKKSMKVQ